MSAQSGAPEVRLSHGGRLRGSWHGGLRVFKGIRYALPPFGERRFAPPVPMAPWQGVREATDFGPPFPHWPRHATPDAEPVGGEDAMSLNVWAPDAPPGTRLPVMVWVHGGGFVRGSAAEPLYDGTAFARQGVVFVSIQYRLGIDGFAHLADAPPNRGLLDQLMALRWVRDHIGAWGGDAGQVTVFGQSAGAGAIACLMGLPEARGLFQRVILQSPSVACQTVDEAQAALAAVCALAGTVPDRAVLAHAPLAPLLRAVQRLTQDARLRRTMGLASRHLFPLRPVLDGQMLVAPPLQALQAAWEEPSPLQLLVGHNADEMRLYHVPGGGLGRIAEADVEDFARSAGVALPPGRTGTPGERLCALQSDYHYAAPAAALAHLAATRAASAHRYRFVWPSPGFDGHLGAAHGVELPFVFGNLDNAAARELAGLSPPSALSQRMQQAWLRFAKTGDPGWAAHTPALPCVQVFGECEVAAP
ncbi:carboxylesterase/lipase family protein [Pseudacidovorax intermedius]|uniref:Carboxylesterase n=1 Tax=Pseudacidovorax intermedius TaxID=433924 RepID=A0A147GQR5_9BURK|nr:carboxylesterase family protein [Pseudacidovorax intermedius]KTT18386.1 carboxylesterase [Pseudacidovorax intermedius]